MKNKEISMQLYTTRHFQPYDPILKFLSDSGIINIELFGLESMNTDEFKSMMDKSNISSKSTHVSYESLSDSSDIIYRANSYEKCFTRSKGHWIVSVSRNQKQ